MAGQGPSTRFIEQLHPGDFTDSNLYRRKKAACRVESCIRSTWFLEFLEFLVY